MNDEVVKSTHRAEVVPVSLRVHGQEKSVNSFWQVVEKYPTLLAYLEANPGTTVYGEIHGNTNRIKYGFTDGNRFAAFDVYRDGRFLDASQFLSELTAANVPLAPLLSSKGDHEPQPYSAELVKSLREGPTFAAGSKAKTIREGLVIRPWVERSDDRLGRCILKAVNPDFHAL